VGKSHFASVHVATSEGVPVVHENVYVDPDAVSAPPATEFAVIKARVHVVDVHVGESQSPSVHVATPEEE